MGRHLAPMINDVVVSITLYPFDGRSLDFVIFPYNFYHNWLWGSRIPDPDIHNIVPTLREKGIGVVTMKPFAGDFLAMPLKHLGTQFDGSGEVNVAKASLRYIINSGLDIDTTLGGMYNPYHVYEDIDAYLNPAMSAEERDVLMKIRKKAKVLAANLLPPHYKFLENWSPDTFGDDSDLRGTV